MIMSEYDDAMVYYQGARADRAQRRSELLKRAYQYRVWSALVGVPGLHSASLQGPPESPIAWRLTRPNYMGYGEAPLPTDGDEISNIREWAVLDTFHDPGWAEDAENEDYEPYPEEEDRFWGWAQ
jgi:hypothetical protein